MGRVEINTRVINKHDTEANWNSHPSFIPDKSEIIVYDKDDNYNYPRVKIGDGVTTVVALPFIDDNTLTSVSNLQTEVNNVKASTSDEAINTKVNNAIQDIGALTIDLNSAESGTAPFTNSDMLGGLPASSYLQVADFPQALTDAGVVKSVGGKVPNASGEVVLVPVDIGAVPTSRTVNGKALNSNISLTYSDVDAAAASHTHDYASSSHTHTSLRSLGNVSPETGRTANRGGVYTYGTTNGVNGGPTTYTAMIGFGQGTGGTGEISVGWTSGMGMWYRALRDYEDSWYNWVKVYDQKNLKFSLSGTTLTITTS